MISDDLIELRAVAIEVTLRNRGNDPEALRRPIREGLKRGASLDEVYQECLQNANTHRPLALGRIIQVVRHWLRLDRIEGPPT